MKKVTEHFFCDICKQEGPVEKINYPVIFHTDQTEGRPRAPYTSQEQLEVCNACQSKLLMLDAWGGQGCNQYEFKATQTGEEKQDG